MLGRYPIEGSGASGIAGSVERAVGSGELSPGSTLPPIRELAAHLGVNPNTVAAAYRLLRERGVIETDGRRGSRVRARPATTARSAIGVAVPEGVRDLSTGNPDTRLLPPLGRALQATGRTHHLYGEPEIDEALAALARQRLAAERVPSAHLALTSGALDGIERVLGAHLRPGDRVAVEDPCWANVLDLVAALSLQPLPVRVDDDGPLPDDLAAALDRDAQAVMVTTRAHNPTGAAVSASRARVLRGLLRERPQVLLVEDDHGADVAGVRLQTLAGTTTHWAYVRSISKAYGPDLRLAVLTGDATTVDRVRGRQRLGTGWVSHLLQETLTALWQDRDVADRIARATAAYDHRRTALLRALRERGVKAHGRTGFNVWVRVADETAAVAALLPAGWAVAPGARFRIATGPAVRVTISPLDVGEIDRLADDLATAVRRPAARRGV